MRFLGPSSLGVVLVSIALGLFYQKSSLHRKQTNSDVQKWFPNPSGRCQDALLDWNSSLREERFPSVNERVCLYMTRWYDPHFGTLKQWKPPFSYHQEDDSILVVYRNNVLVHVIERHNDDLCNDVPFYLFKDSLSIIQQLHGQKHWLLVLFYGADTKKLCDKFPSSIPLLLTWGDQELKTDAHLPIVAKWRFNNLSNHTKPIPIVAPLDTFTHFGKFDEVKEHDIPWDKKVNKAVWRGTMTGIVDGGRFPNDFDLKANAKQVCLKFDRCRLVFRNHNATDSDVGLSFSDHEELKSVDGVDLMKNTLSINEQLQYKMILSIEGNDVATGLKWGLFSNSVVLMPRPTKSIFSLEILLKPWVHYVPLDLDNISKAIQWVKQNQDEAQMISKRATNFINDLFFHPDALHDNERVLEELARRITALWENNEDSAYS